MKYYLLNDEIYAFESDGSQDAFIPGGAEPITEVEAVAILNQPPTPEEQAAEARAYVLAELAALDAKYLPPRTLADLAMGDEYALEQKRKHTAAAQPWRDRWWAIPGAEEIAAEWDAAAPEVTEELP